MEVERGQCQYKGRGSVGSGQSEGRAKSEESGIYRKQRGQRHYKGWGPNASALDYKAQQKRHTHSFRQNFALILRGVTHCFLWHTAPSKQWWGLAAGCIEASDQTKL